MAFREISVEQLKDNPFTLINKDWMLITAGDAEKHNTMTASWGGVGELWGKYVSTINHNTIVTNRRPFPHYPSRHRSRCPA